MSLAGRLSAFFLIVLALVLVAMSAAVYGLAGSYLYRQHDDRLEAALDTLEAAVDVEPGALEWEPDDRRITLGTDSGTDQVRWSVGDPEGRTLDRSRNAASIEFPPAGAPDVAPLNSSGDGTNFADVSGWRLAGRRLRLADLLRRGHWHPEDDDPDEDIEYPELTLTVGLSPAPVHATLTWLGLALAGTSSAVWILCALLGRSLARRALAPLTRMAEDARKMNADELGWSLPEPGTRDELDALASAYNGLLGRLHEAFETQRRFAGEASHQLRTPLAGLLSQLDLALRRERPAEEYRRTLSLARDEATRLRHVVESLLFLARPTPDTSALEYSSIDLARWVPGQLTRWEAHPRSSDLRFSRLDDLDVVVRAHPDLLAQSFGNLLDNALKYGEPGTPVVVSVRREGNAALITVQDHGPGMTAEELAHVFEPFYRSRSARSRGRDGFGLGLSIARRIVASFEGSLQATSQPGHGSLFTIRLPATARLLPTSGAIEGESLSRVNSGVDPLSHGVDLSRSCAD